MPSIIWWTKIANILDPKKIQIGKRRRKRKEGPLTLEEKNSRWSIECNLRVIRQTAKVKVKNERYSGRKKLGNSKEAVALIDILEESPIIVKARKMINLGRVTIIWGLQKGTYRIRTMKAIRLLVPMTTKHHPTQTSRAVVPKVTFTSMTSTIRMEQITRKAKKAMVSMDSANLYQVLVVKGLVAMESR